MASQQPTRPATARIRLARIAERVVASDERVCAAAGGSRWVTRDGDRTIAGIVVAENVTGSVDIALHLDVVAPSESLAKRAEHIRGAIATAAGRAGLADRLGAIDVEFHDLAVTEEVAP